MYYLGLGFKVLELGGFVILLRGLEYRVFQVETPQHPNS